MHEVKPTVELIACTDMTAWLQARVGEFGGDRNLWALKDSSSAEQLIEFSGRRCYNSFAPGVNPNVTKIRTDEKEYFRNVLSSGHGSVLEHASATFSIEGVTRVFTAELCRHRAGCAISEQSLRYVKLDDLPYRVPDFFTQFEADELKRAFSNAEDSSKSLFDLAATHEGFDDFAKMPFALKKKWTSAIRRVVPMGVATGVVWTANMRALRHIIPLRTSVHAEEEIRAVFDAIAGICTQQWPLIFQDFNKNKDGEWEAEFKKV